jgi:hypothetical protein
MKTKEEQWKERREYDAWHSNYMNQLKNKISEELIDYIDQHIEEIIKEKDNVS